METEVLIVGAGPVGLMAGVELRRRGIDVVIVDMRDEVAPWAKAVGVQPRTLEIFDAIGADGAHTVVRKSLGVSTIGRIWWLLSRLTNAVAIDLCDCGR